MINRVTLLGIIKKITEVRPESGINFFSVHVVTEHSYFNKKLGSVIKEDTLHKVYAFDRLKKVIENYASIMDYAYVDGHIMRRKYQKEGAFKIDTYVVANEIKIINAEKMKNMKCLEDQVIENYTDFYKG